LLCASICLGYRRYDFSIFSDIFLYVSPCLSMFSELIWSAAVATVFSIYFRCISLCFFMFLYIFLYISLYFSTVSKLSRGVSSPPAAQ
jgi:hypothetical protein